MTDGVVTKYYYAGSQRIATLAPGASAGVRTGGTLYFILGDHLGSTSLITFANGNGAAETRYKAWGEVRYSSGNTPTKYQYTGQYSYASDFGLMFYNSRWYDSYLPKLFTKILHPRHTPVTCISYNHRNKLTKGAYDEKHIQENDFSSTGRRAGTGEFAVRQRIRDGGE
ncbi:MAG: hypothetical protein ABI904_23620 [Chloroflexota bacterium]